MTDKQIVDTMRKWFGDPDVAECVFESEQSLKDWLDRGVWYNKAHKPTVINAEYVKLYDKDGKPLSSEYMIYNKEMLMIYKAFCTMEFLEANNIWRMEKRTP